MGKITRQELNTSVVNDLQNGKEAKEEIVQARGTSPTLNARIATVENDQEVDHDALVDVTNELVDARGGESDLKTYLDTTKTATQNALNNVDNKIGILSDLNTEEKSSTVGAINEINTQLADTVNINLNHPKYGIKGDGTDETSKIRQAFEDAMSTGRPLDLGIATTKYAISESIVVDRPITIYANGSNSIFEQLSWGVPCLEVRSQDVTINGHFKTEINTMRTVFDATAMASSKNSTTVKSEQTSAPREAGSAIYCYGQFDRLKIDILDAKGYITGLYFFGTVASPPENISIGSVIVENVDFGVLGGCFKNMKIGTIQAKNILRSQGVDEHAIYLVQKPVKSDGLYIDCIQCNGIETSISHVASIKYTKNFHINSIIGDNVGALFNAINSQGYVGSIQSVSNVGDNLGNSIAIQEAGTDVTIDNIDITSEAKWESATSFGRAIAVTGGAKAILNNPKIKMISTSPSNAFYLSGNGYIDINNPIIEYGTSLTTVYAIYVANDARKVKINNPTLIGHNKLYYKYTGAIAEIVVNPNNINQGTIVKDTIIATDDKENTTFFALNKIPYEDTVNSDTRPIIRSLNFMRFNRTVANTITEFRSGTNGQEFICLMADNMTTIQNGTTIVTKSGSDITAGSRKLIRFVWYSGVAYEI